MAKKEKDAGEKKEKSFEACMAELDKIQEKLGSGDLQLDKAIEEYERGVTLLKDCYGLLEKVEKRISILTSDGKGGLKETPFRAGKEMLGEDEDGEDEEEEDEEESEDDEADLLF